MIRKIKVTDYPRLMEIWESAVLSTHDFLKEEDFIYYKGQLPVYFQYVNLFGFEQEGTLIGFMGIAEGNLEMLFIDNNYRGTGVGKKLITYAIDNLQVTKVDVNEQNIQAVGFYKHIGFNIYEGGNLAASKIRNLECPNYEICLIDYGCGKFNRKIHIMEQYP